MSWPVAWRSFVETFCNGLLGEFLQELGAAGQVELANQCGLHAAVAPGLALAEVFGERLARDVSQVGHRDGLHGSRGGVADQRRLEDAGDERGRGLDQPELQEHLDHLAADHPDVGRGELHAVDAGQLRDHLELDGSVGDQLEGGERVGEDGAGGDPLELLDDIFRPLIALDRELLLGLSGEQMGSQQQVARAERFAFLCEDLGDAAAQGVELSRASPRGGSRPFRRAVCTRTLIGRGEAAPATMSSGGTSPRSRSFSLARIAALSASLNRSVLLKKTIDRFPWRTRAASGSYSVRVRSWSRTKISRSARAARSRASRSRAEPPSPISESPGVSVRNRLPSTPPRYRCGFRLAGSFPSPLRSCRPRDPEAH